MDKGKLDRGISLADGALPVCAAARALDRAEERVREMIESRECGVDLVEEARAALCSPADVPGREEFKRELDARAFELVACRHALKTSASSSNPRLAKALAWLVALGGCAYAPRDEDDDELSPILDVMNQIDPGDPSSSISKALLELPSWRESLARGCEAVFGPGASRSCRLVVKRPSSGKETSGEGGKPMPRRMKLGKAAAAAAGIALAAVGAAGLVFGRPARKTAKL